MTPRRIDPAVVQARLRLLAETLDQLSSLAAFPVDDAIASAPVDLGAYRQQVARWILER